MFNHSSGMNCINGCVDPKHLNPSPDYDPNKLYLNEINFGDSRLY